MNLARLVEWIVAFSLGVASSITASSIIFLFNANAIVDRAMQLIVQHESSRRLRNLQRNYTLGSNDPHAVVRAEWASALYDLGSSNQDDVLKALQSLCSMADLLGTDERDVAHEAIRRKYAVNPLRNADTLYLNTMQKLQT